MVENIFGRKTYPQTKYHDRVFLQSSHSLTVHHRRISGEPPNLRTIAETDGDDDDDLPSQRVAAFLPPVQSDLGATGRKPRAISLPTIYRDGSYLRINFPAQLRNEGTGRRRFSEPAVSWNSKFRPAIVPMSNDKKLTNDQLPLARDISLRSGGVTLPQKIQIEKRRHSDPLIYSSEIIQKFENLKTDSQKNNHDIKGRNDVENPSTSCDEKSNDIPQSQRSENVSSAAPMRRRKSSLVPIPFSIVKSCSSRKQKAPKRRLSFPLSKNEEELTKNLPTFHKLAWVVDDNVDHYSSSNESLKSVDLLIRKDSLGESVDLPEQDDIIPEKKHNCEEIITQWMKFFG